MGFRFRKSIKIMPGVRLNIGKTGFSASAGVKGASVNIGKPGVSGTVGVPGTGISYTEKLTPKGSKQPRPALQTQINNSPATNSKGLLLFWLIVLIVLGGLFLS